MTRTFPDTLTDLLRSSAEAFGDRPFLTSREGLRARTMSFRALEQASGSVARSLIRDYHLCRGQCAILLAPPGVRTVAVLFGLFRAGIVAVPLDLNATSGFLEAVLQKTEAAAVIAPRSMNVPRSMPLIAIEDLPLASAETPDAPEPGAEDVAEIVFTSGTTGDPKGVVLTQQNILSDLRGASGVVPRGEEMNLLSILPLSHMFEQTVGLFLPLLKGGMVHYAPSLRAASIAAEIRRHRVTGMVVVPRFLELLLAAAEDSARSRHLGWVWNLQHRVALRLPMGLRRILFLPLHRGLGRRLRYFLCGGAALSADLMEAWERTGIRVIEGYGATECAPVILSNGFDDRVPGTVGRPVEGVTVRISDEGELQARGANVFGGYWRDPDRTRAAFTADGWYKSDDVAEQIEGDRFRIVGRLSERIVLPSGMNVYPADVERELCHQPEIRECAVLGLRRDMGEHLHAVIRLADGMGEADASRAVERANASLSGHQRLTGFTLWNDEFPKTALQKIKRKVLKQALEARVDGAAKPRRAAPQDHAARILRRVARSAPSEISAEMRLDIDLGLDSLGRVELAAEIEKETGRDVQEDVIAQLATVGDLADLLSNPGPAVRAAPFARWPRSFAASLARRVLQPIFLFLPHAIFARPYLVIGRDALVSQKGPVLLIANHASHADTLAILRALPVRLRSRTSVAAAADYFFAKPPAAFLAAAILGAFPFSREGRVRASLEHCGLLADEGWSILIYPEGTRSPDGRLLPFKTGIGLLAVGLDVPVVPIAVTGGVRLLPKGAAWPRRTAVSVRFGEATTIPPEMTAEEATILLETRVRELLEASENPLNEGRKHGR